MEWRGWRILPLVCYDLRFPVWSRNLNDYDLAIYVANWPAPRSLHWQALLTARAIENQAYVAGCNRVGSSDNLALWINHPAVTAIMAAVAIAADAITPRYIRLILNRAGCQQCLPVQRARCRPVGNVDGEVIIVEIARPHRKT